MSKTVLIDCLPVLNLPEWLNFTSSVNTQLLLAEILLHCAWLGHGARVVIDLVQSFEIKLFLLNRKMKFWRGVTTNGRCYKNG